MRELPPPPSSTLDTFKVFEKHALRLGDKDVRAFISKANSEYWHWETVRHVAPPAGITHEEAWALLRVTRLASARILPLRDNAGKAFRYWLPEATQETLHEIDQLASGISAIQPEESESLTNLANRVLVETLISESIATSKIEGAVTAWKVAEKMLKEGRKPTDKSEQMIFNSYRVIQKLEDRIDEPLSIDFLHQIQTEITYKTLANENHAGRFRTSHDEINIVDQTTADIIYTPPPAEQLNERIGRLIEFANTPSTGPDFIHPFVKAAILHFWLAYEHPYCDGNGRTARALIIWFLLKHKYALFQYLPLSKVVVQAPAKYYRSFLYAETDENDLTYSIVFLTDAARRAIRDLEKRLSQLKQEQRSAAKAIQELDGINYRQRALLKELVLDPNRVISIQYHRNSHGVTYQTARTDLLNLVERGYLKLQKIKKKFVFEASDKVRKQ